MDDITAKRNIKDSVFTNLFRDNKYVFELYQALFPEDKTATVDDIETITLEYDLVNRYYNDLGFRVGNRLIVLVEAQSEWSDNIIIRIFLYLAQTWKDYIDKNDDMDLHSTKKVVLPRPELFVIYTGNKKNIKDVVTYSGEFLNGEESNIDIKIKVIRDGNRGDIINQYVRFTKILNEQFAAHGRTEKAITETIRICRDQDVLRKYLENHKEEVVSIMIALYDFDNSLDKRIRLERSEAMKKGEERGMAKGMAKGMEKGEEEQAKKSAREMFNDNMSVDKIAKYVKYPIDTIKQWLGLLPA